MTLYEIDRRLDALIDPETGELLDFEAFSSLQMERETKIENTALLVKNLTAEADAIKKEIDALTERRRAATAKADRLKDYLSRSLSGQKFSTARCAVTFRQSAGLDVTDAHTAAEWLERHGHMDLVTYDAPKLDKRAVKKLIEDSGAIPGVGIVSRQSLQVR